METLYHSTRSKDEVVTSKQAILAGIAPDGGLYVSDQLGATKLDLAHIAGQSYHATARDVLSTLLSDYTADEVGSSVPAAGGGSTPIDPPIGNGTTTGGSEEDDWRRREREEKIRRVQEQYGFTLGKKPVTPEEIEGKKRYTADRARETAIRNREIDFMLHGKERARKAAAKKRDRRRVWPAWRRLRRQRRRRSNAKLSLSRLTPNLATRSRHTKTRS